MDGTAQMINLAKVYAWTGEKEFALDQLASARENSGGVTYGELKLNPQWNALRGDARFEKIVASLCAERR